MSSTNTTTRCRVSGHEKSTKPLTDIKKGRQSRKVFLHQPMSPSPPDDWILFPQEVVTEKHSSIRHARNGKLARSTNRHGLLLPSPDNHVTERKATLGRLDSKHDAKPYKPSTCLNHMSARNCTAACLVGRPMPEIKVPPKAPSPPRLPTPDLSDFGEDDLWSCCRSSESNESDMNTQDQDDFWNEMDDKITNAMREQKVRSAI